MKLLKQIIIACLLVTLTACKIDLSIIGIGAVKTDTGTFDCTSGSTTSDCTKKVPEGLFFNQFEKIQK